MSDIGVAFHKYFEIVNVDTQKLREVAYNLRFRALCVDNIIPGFDAADYPDELECDKYDVHSIHILLRHRSTKEFIGTTCLIRSNPLNPEDKFPTELHTRFHPEFALNALSRQHTAEVSRFAILSNFFKRKGERGMVTPLADPTNKTYNNERRCFPHPMLGLVVGIAQACAQNNIKHLISAMDPALNRLLGFYGLESKSIGPPTNYHGLRSPYYIYLEDVQDRIQKKYQSVWKLVSNHDDILPTKRIANTAIHERRLLPAHTDNIHISR